MVSDTCLDVSGQDGGAFYAQNTRNQNVGTTTGLANTTFFNVTSVSVRRRTAMTRNQAQLHAQDVVRQRLSA